MGIKEHLKDKSKEELLDIIFRKDNVEKDLRGELQGVKDKFNKYVEKSQHLIELSKTLVKQNDKLLEDNKKGSDDFNNLCEEYEILKNRYDVLRNDYEDLCDDKTEYTIYYKDMKVERIVFTLIVAFLLGIVIYLMYS